MILKSYSDYETVKDEMLPAMQEQEVFHEVELEGKQHLQNRRFAIVKHV